MNNNDILRQLRYALDFSNEEMIKIFSLSGLSVDLSTLLFWLKPSDDDKQQVCQDDVMSSFLDGLILLKRGPNPNQENHRNSGSMNNNLVLKKIRIALELREEEMIAIMKLADFTLSKYELSALFRRTDHKNYRPCGNQFLRNFLRGLAIHYRQ